ncbi:MAG: NAD(P)/FAD-dependent oxidoreductase [Aquabacterium sp.]
MDRVDTVVIGAGVVGLACARALAASGREVVVVEAETLIGSATSARNSEVIHAGLYYAEGSRRAALCVRGKALLYAYCAQSGVGHARLGKLIVACDAAEQAALARIQAQAAAAGVHDLVALDGPAAQAMEPALRCQAALWSPSTGIVDSHGLMLALLGDAERNGAMLAVGSTVVAGEVRADGIVLQVASGPAEAAPTALLARQVVNSAGLQAVAVARSLTGWDRSGLPQARFAKGCYYALSGRAPFSRLVYPAPGAAGHLGLHLTLDLAGQARFGPTFRWIDDVEYGVDPLDEAGAQHAIRRWWPGLPDAALQPGYSGVRPKIHGPDEPLADFRIDGPADHGVPGLVNLLGIESPGLTASLAIAQEVVACLT